VIPSVSKSQANLSTHPHTSAVSGSKTLSRQSPLSDLIFPRMYWTQNRRQEGLVCSPVQFEGSLRHVRMDKGWDHQ